MTDSEIIKALRAMLGMASGIHSEWLLSEIADLYADSYAYKALLELLQRARNYSESF